MGRPPDARPGNEGAYAGRPIVAGAAPFVRALSPRASSSDLWAAVDGAVTAPNGFKRLEKMHGVHLDTKAQARAQAFINQARQYYGAIATLEPVAKPLVVYYLALNLTKAFLTVTSPQSTKKSVMRHGLGQDYQEGVNYSFKRERFKVAADGAFRLLAEATGMQHCWANGYRLSLHELMPYLPDGYAAYADANAEAPPCSLCERSLGTG